MNPQYDYIICGAGLSGLLLLYYVAKEHPDASILVIDKKESSLEHKTFSFWHTEDFPAELRPLIHKSWKKYITSSNKNALHHELTDYTYSTILGNDLESYVKHALQANHNITFLIATIHSVHENNDLGIVETEKGTYSARYIFTSIAHKNIVLPHHEFSITQHYEGWLVTFTDPVFDDTSFTFMDLQDSKGWNFFYVLPYSTHEALVEYVTHDNTDIAHIDRYIQDIAPGKSYTVKYIEGGQTMLTSYQFPSHLTSRVFTIGMSAGRIKSSSGYAFTRILKHSQFIAHHITDPNFTSLNKQFLKTSPFYRFADTLLLRTAKISEDTIAGLTKKLALCPADALFRFLDERATLKDILCIGCKIFPYFRYAFKR